jgi:hypothetical protein
MLLEKKLMVAHLVKKKYIFEYRITSHRPPLIQMTPIHFAQHISSSSATGYKPFSDLFRFVGRWSVRLFLGRPTFFCQSEYIHGQA